MANNRRSSAGTIGGVVFLLFMVVMGWVMFKMVAGAYSLLAFAAPIFLVLALVFNHSVVTDYFSKLMRTLKEDTGKGLIYVAGTVIGYPFVAAWLALKAYTKRTLGTKRGNTSKKVKEDYLKYEEVEDDEDFLELPDLEEVKQTKSSGSGGTKDNSYEDLFS